MVVEPATVELQVRQQPASNRTDWHAAGKLVDTGNYEHVTALLYQAQIAAAQTNDTAFVGILAAAYQICQACQRFRADIAAYQQAHEAAIRRERELRQQLQEILSVVREYKTAVLPEPSPPNFAKPNQNLPPDDFELEQKPGLWQRVQNFLGWKHPTSLEPEALVEWIQKPMPQAIQPTELSEKSAIKEAALLTAEAEASLLPLIEEIDPSVPFPLPPDAAETKSFAGEIMISIAEEANLVIAEKPEQQRSPTLVVYCLGFFRVYQDDQPIQDWKSSKGKAIFKYLLVHRGVSIAKEVLMDLFWPDSTPDAARNNLNVAIYGLRQTLRQTRPDLSHILFQDDHYLLKPGLQIWVDVEAFMEHFGMAQNLEKRGELTLAIHEYRTAEALYQGEFLADDRYEEWPILQRQQLEADYFSLLDRLSRYYLDQEDYDACATVCKKMLAVDPCREEAHCHLMRYYSQQNQRYLALRQYHLCIEALANELDVGPSQATIDLYEQIRRAQ